MSKKDWAELACRILAIYLWVQAALGLGYLVAMLCYLGTPVVDISRQYYTIMYGLVPVLAVLLALVIWIKAPALAAKMVGPQPDAAQSEHSGPPTTLTRQDILAVAFSVLGLFLVVKGFQELVLAGYETSLAAIRDWQGLRLERLLTSLAQLGLGVWIMLGSQAFAFLLSRARTAGVAAPPDHHSSDPVEAAPLAPRTAPVIRTALFFVILAAILMIVAAVLFNVWIRDRVSSASF